jgi:spore coat polysaccharide biosynthesis protein SpsF
MDYAVRINGDNLFTDPVTLDQMLHVAENGNYDFISNVKGRTFPRGMSIEIVRTAFYNQALTRFSTPGHFEHVTSYLYEHDDFGKQYHFTNVVEPEAAGINMAIDTPEDFSLAEKMISRMNKDHREYNLRDLFALWKEVKNEISVGG